MNRKRWRSRNTSRYGDLALVPESDRHTKGALRIEAALPRPAAGIHNGDDTAGKEANWSDRRSIQTRGYGSQPKHGETSVTDPGLRAGVNLGPLP